MCSCGLGFQCLTPALQARSKHQAVSQRLWAQIAPLLSKLSLRRTYRLQSSLDFIFFSTSSLRYQFRLKLSRRIHSLLCRTTLRRKNYRNPLLGRRLTQNEPAKRHPKGLAITIQFHHCNLDLSTLNTFSVNR